MCNFWAHCVVRMGARLKSLREFDMSAARPLFGESYNPSFFSQSTMCFFFFSNTVSDAVNTSGGRKNDIRRRSGVGVRFCVISRFVHLLLVAANPAQCLNDVLPLIMLSFLFLPPPPSSPSVLTSQRCDIPVRIHGLYFVCLLRSPPRVFVCECACVCLVRIIQTSLCQKLL